MMRGTLLLAALLLGPGSALGLDLDLGATRSSDGGHSVLLAGSHRQEWVNVTALEVGGKFKRQSDRVDVWDFGFSQVINLRRGFALDDQWRAYHTHYTAAGGLGLTVGWATVTAGARTDYGRNTDRATYGRIAGKVAMKWGDKDKGATLSVDAEWLRNDNEARADYRAKLRMQQGWWYSYIATQRVRHKDLSSVGLGVSVF
jgi:hypothetical protein